MTAVTFSVPFIRGKARPRFSNGRAYIPKSTKDAERVIRLEYCRASRHYHGAVVRASEDVPVTIAITTTRNVRTGFRKRDGDSHADVSKPDADNIAKLVMDALNGLAYADDSQVDRLIVEKAARVRGRKPMTLVYVSWKDANEDTRG